MCERVFPLGRCEPICPYPACLWHPQWPFIPAGSDSELSITKTWPYLLIEPTSPAGTYRLPKDEEVAENLIPEENITRSQDPTERVSDNSFSGREEGINPPELRDVEEIRIWECSYRAHRVIK